ncbi:cytochrome P450 [Infundibulicybe gibba]|nr:cytochrome P450 [Infundibulicybe gibba]
MIIVNSTEIMSELDKKGSIYSDRPTLTMGGELVGYRETLVLLRYGARLRTFRRYVSRLIGGPTSMERFEPTLEAETHRFAKRILKSPENLLPHLRKRVPLSPFTLWGLILVQEDEDPFVNLIEKANSNFSAATVPGAFLVDSFPSLRHLPEWLPGMGFKKLARAWAQDTSDMAEIPYSYARRQIAAGISSVSFISDIMDGEAKLSEDATRDIKFAAASMYGGGAETTVSARYAFFLAMVLNPGVQREAQAELDAVVGHDRLPVFADRDHLPYINAIVSETLRWNSAVPTGIPHRAMEDGIIGGYFVPKDSIIIANLWGMMHDPETYPDPFRFDPSRHISSPGKPAQRDPRSICFGFGRRICPGMHLAEASLFISIATSLALFDISKKVENGIPIMPVHENTSGIVGHPKPFKCEIKPRSEKAIFLISEEP